jgi:hypothetical protein
LFPILKNFTVNFNDFFANKGDIASLHPLIGPCLFSPDRFLLTCFLKHCYFIILERHSKQTIWFFYYKHNKPKLSGDCLGI